MIAWEKRHTATGRVTPSISYEAFLGEHAIKKKKDKVSKPAHMRIFLM